MNYKQIKPAVFLSRPNRFIAICRQGQEQVTAHVKNTGRCAELLIPGAKVWLEYSDAPGRKTPCDLVVVQKNGMLINMDSQAPNKVVQEGLQSGKIALPGFGVPDFIKSEYTFGGSRFDFFVKAGEREGFVEVKGVTLEEDGVVYFPDAPTERGIKHIQELETAVAQGYYGCVLFVVQLKGATYFLPNDRTQPQFGVALRHAQNHGVNLIAYDCKVTPHSLELDECVELRI